MASARAGRRGRGAAPRGGERKNDGRGGLSDPWPAAGRGARRNRSSPSFAHEETASRPGGVDVPRRPSKRGQGYFASHASQLTPATNTTDRKPLPPSALTDAQPFTARRCPARSILHIALDLAANS